MEIIQRPSSFFRASVSTTTFRFSSKGELSGADEKLQRPGSGLGDIYQIDIGELKIRK